MTHRALSLDALFAPPTGWHGTNAVLCAMSADRATLDQILERFTQQTASQRRLQGQLRAVLMLDAAQPLVPPLAVPGLFHVPPPLPEDWLRRTALLHAKVALMAYAREPYGRPGLFRVVVSTGNWTTESLSAAGSIDMAWSVQSGLRSEGESHWDPQGWADCRAGREFLERLLRQLYAFDLDAFLSAGAGDSWFATWKRVLDPAARLRSRFIHSLDRPLFGQIQERFPSKGFSTLVAGSGFYEQESRGGDKQPTVLSRLEELGRPRTRYLVVNPSQAGAVEAWARAAADGPRVGKWVLCVPTDPLVKRGAGRAMLHAKFVAGVHGERRVTALYLGSGNLSKMGLLSHAALDPSTTGRRRRNAGHVEAGVVLTHPETLDDVWRGLACGDCYSPTKDGPLQPGESEPPLTPLMPPPVIVARVAGDRLDLEWHPSEQCDIEARAAPTDGWTAVPFRQSIPLKSGQPPPSSIQVRRSGDSEAFEVPVIAVDGSYCRQALARLSANDVMEALFDFPAPPSITDEDEGDGVAPDSGGRGTPSNVTGAASYPLRTLMTLVEGIADRGAEVSREQFPIWLCHLRTLLVDQLQTEAKQSFRSLGINPFPVLREPPFLVSWLADDEPARRRYLDLLAAIEHDWDLTSYPVPRSAPVMTESPDA